MLRRFLIGILVLLVVLLVVADRVGAVVAAHVLADKIQTDEHLPSRPDVSIGGFPFLTQAIAGNYSDVTVTVHGLTVSGVPVSTLVAHLHGVHVSASAAIKGDVHRVPVDRADGRVVLSFADLNRYLAGRLRISATSGLRVSIVRNVVQLSPSHVPVPVTVSIPLVGLPFRISLAKVRTTPDGIVATGTVRHLVLGAG